MAVTFVSTLDIAAFNKYDDSWIRLESSLFKQPAIEVGKYNFVGSGLGWPNAIHKENIKEHKTPTMDPTSLADSISIPKVKIPSKGPPTTPNIVKLAWNN